MAGQLNIGDEAGMIASILAGNTQLYHELIRPHERSVYMMALSFMKNEADAEDVAQEAVLKAFQKLPNFRFEAKFSTWLISITLNEARGRLRRHARVRMESIDVKGACVCPALLRDWREIPAEALERREIGQMIQKAITNLPRIYRQVFVLRDLEGFSVSDTAEALGITVSSVKVRLHRARMMLQKQLAPQLQRISVKGWRRSGRETLGLIDFPGINTQLTTCNGQRFPFN